MFHLGKSQSVIQGLDFNTGMWKKGLEQNRDLKSTMIWGGKG